MRKPYLGIVSLLLCLSFSASAQIITFSFSGNTGDEATWPSSTAATGIEPSLISRGAGVTAAAHADRFNSTGWTTGTTLNVADYIEFTITPSTGYAVNISSIEIHHRRSSAGPRRFLIRTGLDGFTTNATTELIIPDVNTQQNSTFVLLAPINTTSPVTFRIYAYAAETAAGSWGPGEDTGSDLLIFAALSTLPVNFTNVKAYLLNQHVKITWSNSTESDIAHYVLEYSSNGRTFSQLTIIDPVNNNNLRADYGFEHTQPGNKNYYRIKAVETSGTNVYSTVVKVTKSEAISKMTIYSNPGLNDRFKFEIKELKAGNYQLVIWNTIGQPVKRVAIQHSGGLFVSTTPLPSLSRGIYFLEVVNTTGPVSKLTGKFSL
jgi:hypothetical protein